MNTYQRRHSSISMKKRFAILFALTELGGCASQPARDPAFSWDVKHVVERSVPSSSGTCDVKITTYNNTKEAFLGVNTQFVLLDPSGRMVGDVRYFVNGALLPGNGLSVTRRISANCADVATIRILYLTLPIPTGYYRPRRLLTEVR